MHRHGDHISSSKREAAQTGFGVVDEEVVWEGDTGSGRGRARLRGGREGLYGVVEEEGREWCVRVVFSARFRQDERLTVNVFG